MKFAITLSAFVSIAAAAEPYYVTCQDESLEGFIFKARCKNRNGDLVDTSLDLNKCLTFSDDTDEVVHYRDGNISQACTDCWLSAQYESMDTEVKYYYDLTCNCRGPNSPYWNKMDTFIENIDGQMLC
ncbi:hypothetical protein NM208_g3595 [Fusarium decemcellulare]|uniref:Uncharacterized protein n=1 Tax=Fusarium decemcellulare TaxID=57161 RepID=A0ACC1SNI4_9HYPO|nr:hypothetical protein NM208_g3595 [Fusarium decemcellulare]